MIPFQWLEQAEERISAYIKKTPLEYDASNKLYLKWENLQITGSFKARGAFNKVLTLLPWEREQGITTASAGNHGKGVALAGKILNAPVTVFAPENASQIKTQAIQDLGAELKFVTGGYGEAEQAGIEYARESGTTWISAYNDGQVIAGQGTVATEIMSELAGEGRLSWIVPCGGGGLISGVGAVLKTREKANNIHRLIGAQSEASPFLHDLYYQGTQEHTKELPSLADGLAGSVEKNSLTIPVVRKYVDDMILVREEDIVHAMAFAWIRYRQRIEPSAAVSLAAVLTGKVDDRPSVLIISGGNILAKKHDMLIHPYTLSLE